MPERWLVVTTELAGVSNYTGGVGRRYAALFAELGASPDVEVTVLLVVGPKDQLKSTREWDSRLDVVVLRMPKLARGAVRYLWGALRVRKFTEDRSFDVIFCPEWMGQGALLSRRHPLITNLVTSARLIDWIEDAKTGRTLVARLTRRFQYLMEDLQVRRSRGVLAISTAVLQWNEENTRLPSAREVVPNCIDVAGVRALASVVQTGDGLAEQPAPPTVLFVGRLEARKGIVETLEAFNVLVETMPDVRLHIAGSDGDSHDGLTAESLGSIQSDEAASRTRFLGHVDGPDLFRAMGLATIVLAPSRWEGFGNVALEARAAGSALIVTSGSGFDDFSTSEVDCLMVPPNSPEELHAAVIRLLSDDVLRREIAARGALSVNSYSAAAIAPRVRRSTADLLFQGN